MKNQTITKVQSNANSQKWINLIEKQSGNSIYCNLKQEVSDVYNCKWISQCLWGNDSGREEQTGSTLFPLLACESQVSMKKARAEKKVL